MPGCGTLFWRAAEPLRTAVWLGSGQPDRALSEIFVEIRTNYREKDSSDWLTGTTLKSDYRTGFYLIEISRDRRGEERGIRPRSGSAPDFEFPGWVLEDSVFRLVGSRSQILFVGGQSDHFADEARKLYLLRDRPAELFAIYTPPAGFLLERAVPSPTGEYLAVLETSNPQAASGNTEHDANDDAYRVSLFKFDMESQKLTALSRPNRTAGPDAGRMRSSFALMGGPRWAVDGSGVYVRDAVNVQYLAVRAASAVRANRYPRCFQPYTNSGGPISDGGLRLYFDDEESHFIVQQEAEHLPFDGVPLVDARSAPGDFEDCP
jgi:hypothetical protein